MLVVTPNVDVLLHFLTGEDPLYGTSTTVVSGDQSIVCIHFTLDDINQFTTICEDESLTFISNNRLSIFSQCPSIT